MLAVYVAGLALCLMAAGWFRAFDDDEMASFTIIVAALTWPIAAPLAVLAGIGILFVWAGEGLRIWWKTPKQTPPQDPPKGGPYR